MTTQIFKNFIAQAKLIHGLLTKCEVKMAGYWPSSFFGCLWTETKSRYINWLLKCFGIRIKVLATRDLTFIFLFVCLFVRENEFFISVIRDP